MSFIISGARAYIAGQSSTASGYTSAGDLSVFYNIIDKFPTASDGNATDVGDLTVGKSDLNGQQY